MHFKVFPNGILMVINTQKCFQTVYKRYIPRSTIRSIDVNNMNIDISTFGKKFSLTFDSNKDANRQYCKLIGLMNFHIHKNEFIPDFE